MGRAPCRLAWPLCVGFSLGWLVRHRDDWTGPAVIGPIGALLSFFTYRWGLKRKRTSSAELRPFFVAGMIAGAVIGVLVFGMLVLIIGDAGAASRRIPLRAEMRSISAVTNANHERASR